MKRGSIVICVNEGVDINLTLHKEYEVLHYDEIFRMVCIRNDTSKITAYHKERFILKEGEEDNMKEEIKKVLCKESIGSITKGTMYEITCVKDDSYRVIDDGKQEWWYPKEYFIDIEKLVAPPVRTEKEDNVEEEMVSHPSHYNMGKYEVIDVIDDWKLGFSLGNAVKYIARAGHKWNTVEDLKKAIFYIQHEIDRLEKKEEEE